MVVDHPQLGRVNMTVQVTGDSPDQQVQDTIDLMRRYVIEDARRPELQQAMLPVRHAHPSTQVEHAYALTKGKLSFVQDRTISRPVESHAQGLPVVEVLIRPIDVINGVTMGDCDDFSMLLSALLAAAGVPVSFVTAAADDGQPGVYSHVYVAAYPQGQRVALDASHGPYAGWEVQRASRLKEWPVNWAGNGNGNGNGSGGWS